MFFMFDRNQQRQNAQPGRAISRAVTTASAKDFSELVGIDREFVQDTLALPGTLVGAGIVPAGVQREQTELARIPVAYARAMLVDNVKTVAGGAGVSARAAAHTRQGMLAPEMVI